MSVSQTALGLLAVKTRPSRLGEALVLRESVVTPEPAHGLGNDVGFTHEAGYRVLAAALALRHEFGMHSRRSVGRAASDMRRPDVLCEQTLSLPAPAGRPGSRRVKAACRHPQRLTQVTHRVAVAMRLNKRVFHFCSRAK